MIIDNKGRFFGKVNIVDFAVLAILILMIFIAVKFIFFRPDYFHYKNITAEASFTNVSLSNLIQFSEGKYLLHSDNESYLIVSGMEVAECENKKDSNNKLVYYFNESHTILDEVNVNALIIGAEDYLCDVTFLFNLKARVIDGKFFYKDYEYSILKGDHFEATANNITLRNGEVTSVYEGAGRVDYEKP